MIQVSAPGFTAEVEATDSDTVATLVARAAKVVKGAKVPQRPVYLMGGKRVDPETVVTPRTKRVTVATEAKNG